MNIVSLILQYLGPVIVGKLASSLGINQAIAQKVIAAAVPAILGMIVGKVGQSGGAKALTDVIGKQDPGLLGNLGNLIGGSEQGALADKGFEALGGLLGNSTLGALAGVLGKFGGINEASSKSLVGILAPVVLGQIGQQAKSQSLDAAGLASMLMGQKDNISAALPADFSKMLGAAGLLGALGAAKPASTAPAKPAPVPGTPAVGSAGTAAADFSWWPWAVTIAIAALIWWYAFGGMRTPTVIPAPPRVMSGSTDLGSQLSTSLNGLQGLLASVRDKASAEAALPKLREAQTELNRISDLSTKLPAEGRRTLAGYVASALPILKPLVDQLLANSSYGPILKPVLDGLVSRLNGMVRA